jgi:dTDP-4-amino-4,6-dideoxygalactose transaminase
MNKIFLSPPHMGGEELNYIKESFETNWVAPAGPHLESFEKILTEYNDVKYCAALSSGTAAIHLALIILGVKGGDEVICSSFTFAGSCNPICYLNAKPIFVDSEKDTWNMDPVFLQQALEDRIKTNRKPKAIILVHLYGMPAKVNEIMQIAAHYQIPVIEDAAEGLGSLYQGKKLGSFGDIGIYSFNGNKIITTSGGGAMVSNNKNWIQTAKFLATQARDQAPHYQHSSIGFNYRLSNVCAGIGLGQMKVIDERVRQRRHNFDFYFKRLNKLPGISFQKEPEGSFSNRWLTCIVFPENTKTTPEDLRLALEKENIESRPLWKPMHLQPVFADAMFFGSKVSENLFSRGICLPSGSSLETSDLERICNIVEKQAKSW